MFFIGVCKHFAEKKILQNLLIQEFHQKSQLKGCITNFYHFPYFFRIFKSIGATFSQFSSQPQY